MKRKLQQGFTLIELLVVIAIIGLISSIVITSLSKIRVKARDTKRIADLRQVNTAIQQYLFDKGHAPYLDTFDCEAANAGNSNCDTAVEGSQGWINLEKDLTQGTTKYLSALPKDPSGVSYGYAYNPPARYAVWCNNTGNCGGESKINSFYSIFAQRMELYSPDYNLSYHGVPTFGFNNQSASITSF
jgi:prepilin-type N-terminal cleavage/methylation domain-containing protein